LIPFEDRDATDDEQAAILLEQRRLFYVAITRCTEILVLSSALRLQRDFAFAIGARIQGWWSNPAKTIVSQFLGELGPAAPAARLGTEWCEAEYA